jgi:uncharacterized Zn finger protein (UPF0148 family)
VQHTIIQRVRINRVCAECESKKVAQQREKKKKNQRTKASKEREQKRRIKKLQQEKKHRRLIRTALDLHVTLGFWRGVGLGWEVRVSGKDFLDSTMYTFPNVNEPKLTIYRETERDKRGKETLR